MKRYILILMLLLFAGFANAGQLVYSTFLGGSDSEQSESIAVDSVGCVYITGYTTSTDFPITVSAYDTTYNGGGAYGDVFVTKINSSGTNLIYSTYLGGSNDERAFSIAVDNAGNAYVAGRTISSDFPVTSTSFDTSFNLGRDAFLTKLNSSGSALLYSTYLGGSSDENDNTGDIAIDNTGNAYLTGYTSSADFPITTNAYDSTYNGGYDVFISKINTLFSETTSLVYSTYIGGGSNDVGRSIAIDSIGNIFITGYAQSGNFPTTTNAFDTSHNGAADIFVCKLNSTGSTLIYSTFIGASGTDDSDGISIDVTGNTYITGYTQSNNFPTIPGSFDTTYNGGDDCFFCKLNSDGSALVYSSYLGGNSSTTPSGVVVDNNGNAFITGNTAATDFPTTPDAFDSTYNGGLYDIFLCKVNAQWFGFTLLNILRGKWGRPSESSYY
jgi:hypothetical protein